MYPGTKINSVVVDTPCYSSKPNLLSRAWKVSLPPSRLPVRYNSQHVESIGRTYHANWDYQQRIEQTYVKSAEERECHHALTAIATAARTDSPLSTTKCAGASPRPPEAPPDGGGADLVKEVREASAGRKRAGEHISHSNYSIGSLCFYRELMGSYWLFTSESAICGKMIWSNVSIGEKNLVI